MNECTSVSLLTFRLTHQYFKDALHYGFSMAATVVGRNDSPRFSQFYSRFSEVPRFGNLGRFLRCQFQHSWRVICKFFCWTVPGKNRQIGCGFSDSFVAAYFTSSWSRCCCILGEVRLFVESTKCHFCAPCLVVINRLSRFRFFRSAKWSKSS